jgi:hypothetical protein
LENTPPPPGGRENISQCHLGGKYEKGRRKKGQNLKKEERGKKREKAK